MRLELNIALMLGVGWEFDPAIMLGLSLSAGLYAVGIFRANHRAFPFTRTLSFFAGWLCLIAALVSPLHEMGGFLFSAHMAQHEILMAIAAPLLVLGRPDIACLWAFGIGMRKQVGRLFRLPLAKAVSSPLGAWCLHAVALWLWHIPILFDATISHNWIHALQHFCFLGSALLFWHALLHGHVGNDSYGAGIIYVFTTAIHSSILGALLTFSNTPWYAVYSNTSKLWGFTPLEDQQIGGLIMWVPAGLVYLVVGLWLFAAWIQSSDRHSSFGGAEVSRGA